MTAAPYSLLTRQEAAKFLKISLGALKRRIDAGTLPKPEKFGSGRRLYWRDHVFYAAVGIQITGSAIGDLTVKPTKPAAAPLPASTARNARGSITGSATERARKRNAEQFATLNAKPSRTPAAGRSLLGADEDPGEVMSNAEKSTGVNGHLPPIAARNLGNPPAIISASRSKV
jgi:predicted DNA-binding transcriptional regulator AlpA